MIKNHLFRITIVFLLCALPALLFSQGAGAPGKQVEAKVFTIKFKNIDDVAALVTPLLSDSGMLTIQPKLKAITVQDFVDNIKRIEDAIRQYDMPPKNVEVIINLILATEKTGGSSGGIAKEIRGVSEALSDFTRWTDYERIGSVVMTSAEGSETVSSISDLYRVRFFIDYANEERGIIKFSRFTLEKAVKGEIAQKYEQLLNIGLNLVNGKLLVAGAAKQPGSKRALFLTIQARIQE